MDLALMGMKKLKQDGLLDNMEESEEINACSIVVPVEFEERQKNGLSVLRMRPITIQQKLNHLVVLLPVLEEQSAIHYQDVPMYIRQCVSQVVQTLLFRWQIP